MEVIGHVDDEALFEFVSTTLATRKEQADYVPSVEDIRAAFPQQREAGEEDVWQEHGGYHGIEQIIHALSEEGVTAAQTVRAGLGGMYEAVRAQVLPTNGAAEGEGLNA